MAVWQDGKVEVIENESGHRTTPSIVAFTDEERLVGEAARNQAAQNPHNTVFDAKRLIGMRFSGGQGRVVREARLHGAAVQGTPLGADRLRLRRWDGSPACHGPSVCPSPL